MSVNGETSLTLDFSWIETWYVDVFHFFCELRRCLLRFNSSINNRQSQIPTYRAPLPTSFLHHMLSFLCLDFCFVVLIEFVHIFVSLYLKISSIQQQLNTNQHQPLQSNDNGYIHAWMDGKCVEWYQMAKNEVITTGLFYTLHNDTWILNILRNIISRLKKKLFACFIVCKACFYTSLYQSCHFFLPWDRIFYSWESIENKPRAVRA